MEPFIEAYLDIETTGLAPKYSEITVIGINRCNGNDTHFSQLVGSEISAYSILEALDGVEILYTYNGSRFDLPFIYERLGVNLAKLLHHHDLMYDCWQCNLYGGLKGVERQLGIGRKLTGVNGYEAVRLWWQYIESFDLDALNMLLAYNREDVLNLKVLREKLQLLISKDEIQ